MQQPQKEQNYQKYSQQIGDKLKKAKMAYLRMDDFQEKVESLGAWCLQKYMELQENYEVVDFSKIQVQGKQLKTIQTWTYQPIAIIIVENLKQAEKVAEILEKKALKYFDFSQNQNVKSFRNVTKFGQKNLFITSESDFSPILVGTTDILLKMINFGVENISIEGKKQVILDYCKNVIYLDILDQQRKFYNIKEIQKSANQFYENTSEECKFILSSGIHRVALIQQMEQRQISKIFQMQYENILEIKSDLLKEYESRLLKLNLNQQQREHQINFYEKQPNKKIFL